MSHTYIIAEAGVNHNGDMATARRLIDVAAGAGVDAVKFQCFRAETLVCRRAPKAAYQEETTGSDEGQFEMLKRLELSADAHRELLAYTRARGIDFMSSPFDIASIAALHALDVERLKIPSGEITNLPYLRYAARTGRKLILSTGMSDMEEVKAAVAVLLDAGLPRGNLSLLHCTTEYPAPFEDVNLRAMQCMATAFPDMAVGYSDHTPGIEVAVAAVALGARILEKHFTLDKTMSGPDHRASLEPEQLKALVSAVRNVEKSLGDGVKRPGMSEKKNVPIARKSIVAARDIEPGECLSEENLTVKRPGIGINPMLWDSVVDSLAGRRYNADDLIVLDPPR